MTFTYVPADLLSADATTKNRAIVRLKLGDTESAGHVLEDEEINYLLTENGVEDLLFVALKAAETGLGKLSKKTDADGAGGIRISRSQQFSQWKDVLAQLNVAIAGHAELTLTGTIADQEDQDNSTTRPPPLFSVGMDAND